MGLIKDIYSKAFYEKLSDSLQLSLPAFNRKLFLESLLTEEFKGMEWKQRMQHTTTVLNKFLPVSYPEAISMIVKSIEQLRKDGIGDDKLEFMFFPDYVSTYGLDDLKTSIKALEFITQFISCEFAIRPFILRYETEMLAQMLKWSTHESYRVRRLASEGSRPRLPWAMAIPSLKKDPSGILPILENLKNDPSETVRRSVANNLNDIAKDHPNIVIDIASQWKGISRETDATLKHGARTLLKQGHPEILNHYGLDGKQVGITDFRLLTPVVRIGEYLEFECNLTNLNPSEQTIRLEYAIYYKRNNGTLSKKVFKISERVYCPNESGTITRRQSFKLITTRKFYPGNHKVSVLVNGQEKEIKEFTLTE